MSSLGSYLRELRERRGVSLEEIARTTRVGRPYLEALEAGDFARLPAPVFTRGFVVAYCQALGVPADEALGHYGGGRAVSAEEPVAAFAAASRRGRDEARARGPVLVSFVLVVVLGIALFAFALVLQSGRESPRAGAPAPAAEPARVARADTAPAAANAGSGVAATTVETPAAPSDTVGSGRVTPQPPASVSPAAPPSVTPDPPVQSSPRPVPAPGATASSVPPVSVAAPPIAAISQQDVTTALGAIAAPYRLVARTIATTWIRVRTDDGRQTDETVPAGQTREWISNRPFTVSVGNAGGVRLEVNGRPLPPLGPAGVVIARLVIPSEAP